MCYLFHRNYDAFGLFLDIFDPVVSRSRKASLFPRGKVREKLLTQNPSDDPRLGSSRAFSMKRMQNAKLLWIDNELASPPQEATIILLF